MNSGASDFCHLQLILPGSPTNFEIGIFLSLRLILCYVKSVSWMLKKSDRRPGKIGRTAKNRLILAISCKRGFTAQKSFIQSASDRVRGVIFFLFFAKSSDQRSLTKITKSRHTVITRPK